MNTPTWLQGAALLIWGTTLGLDLTGMMVGALLGALRLFAGRRTGHLQLDERELNRSVDFTVLLVAATLVGLLVAQGLPKGLLTAMSWLPATLLPLMLVASLNQTPLRLRQLALSLRSSARPEAAQVVQPDAPYLAITVLGSAVAAKPGAWTFWLLGGTLATWLWVARPPARRPGLALFLGTVTLALGIAFAAGQGLQRAQLALQEWGIDLFSGTADDPYQSQTRIGDLGRVKLSARIVWRVQPAPPTEVPLLLRTGVFTYYAKGIWLAQRDRFAPLPETPAAAPPRLLLRGESQQGSALLPVPAGTDRVGVKGAAGGRLERNPLGVIRVSEAPPLLELAIGGGEGSQAPPTAADLALPAALAGLLERLPELGPLKHSSEAERLAGLTAWFAASFRYTLFLGDETQGRRDLERFLITERAGHCEYFATATVVLLRALGIPARYVTGYSMQDYSSLEHAFVLRQRHAHAWAEAYVGGRWVEVDTTPATWLTVEEDAAPWWTPALDLASFAWRRIGEWRRELFAAARPPAGWAAGALLLLVLALVWRRHPARPKAIVGAGTTAETGAELLGFRALERQLAELGLARHASEAPRNWLARLGREGRSVLDATRLSQARQVIEALYQRRYALARQPEEPGRRTAC